MARGGGLRGAFGRAPFLSTALVAFAIGFLAVGAYLLPDTFRTVEAKVPNVVGLQYADAKSRLQAAGFEAGEGEKQNHPTAPRGSVLGQLPLPGSLEVRVAPVLLAVALGARRGPVPQLAGRSRREAELALAAAGFDLGDVTERIDRAARGVVIATVPAAGQSLLQPAAVSLVLSAGPDAIAIPDLAGMPAEEALALLGQLGLVAAPVKADSTSTLPDGAVAAQAPRAGALAPPGTAVTLTIARPRPATAEPDDEDPEPPVGRLPLR